MHIILKYIANSGLIRHALQEKFCVGIKKWQKNQFRITQGNSLHRCRVRQVLLYID